MAARRIALGRTCSFVALVTLCAACGSGSTSSTNGVSSATVAATRPSSSELSAADALVGTWSCDQPHSNASYSVQIGPGTYRATMSGQAKRPGTTDRTPVTIEGSGTWKLDDKTLRVEGTFPDANQTKDGKPRPITATYTLETPSLVEQLVGVPDDSWEETPSERPGALRVVKTSDGWGIVTGHGVKSGLPPDITCRKSA